MVLQESVTNNLNHIYGLRAFFILSLLLQHLNIIPFRQAYLAADIFFVTSGFMIASELDGKKHGYYKIISFSFKRIREILLSYLIVVFFTLLFMALFVNANNYDELVDRTIEALFFYFNITPPSDTVMFNRMFDDYLFFSHNWLLCVELHFSLLIPLLYNSNILFSVVGIISCLTQIFLLVKFTKPSSFLYIWQFGVGMMYFYGRNRCQEIHGLGKKVNSLITPACLTIFVLLMLSNIQIEISHLIFCLLTALIIVRNNKQCSSILINPFITWIGRHSYAIYLVHWPLIVYSKYRFHQLSSILVLFVIFLFAGILDICSSIINAKFKSKFRTVMLIFGLYSCCNFLLGCLDSGAKPTIPNYNKYNFFLSK